MMVNISNNLEVRLLGLDRSKWRKGEWDNEPDFYTDIDENTGCRFFIIRMYTGHLCGYVSAPKEHPLFEMHYDDDKFPTPDVHGWITFSAFVKDWKNEFLPKSIYLNEATWLIGFDCNHADDSTPETIEESSYRSYKNIEFVKQECLKLCKWLKENEVKPEIGKQDLSPTHILHIGNSGIVFHKDKNGGAYFSPHTFYALMSHLTISIRKIGE